MAVTVNQKHGEDDEVRQFLIGLARGTAGALLFALPMLMTMEMWFLGLYVNSWRLLLLCILNLPLLLLLARRIGFENINSWSQALRDAITAYGLGIAVSAGVLLLFGILNDQLTASNIVAKVALQSVPASIGALLGRSQLGQYSDAEDEEEGEYSGETGYLHELFMMVVGALFLNLNVAPTEEMILIAYKVTPYHILALCLLSIAIMHGFVYALHFKGSHQLHEGQQWWQSFIRFTLPGYVIAIAISIYTLWTFERLDHTSLSQIMNATVILGVPASIGAASARLIL
ncbi:TIGR02587 family membrane protein [Agrobacterium tumefaciens]|uniref:TIGR02587 family membrane protein n=1 Tax=Agrobacterium tumefaciens TaxID=358 RepID=UPI000DD8885F|nr:TIGR02587 family membrane protein [Agrobacterium tumefaciens]MDR6591353.1 putative integral membrane protein (TIGR02587 family) [Agrobacterium tumefaciens]